MLARMDTDKVEIPAPAKLKRAREEMGLSQQSFGQLIGVTLTTIWRLENGRIRPGAGTALAIERETKGKVTVADWYPEEAAAS